MSSNNAGGMTGTQEQQGGPVPKLRFPEFSDAWHRTELTPHLKEFNERVPSTTSIPIYSSTRSGLKPQSEYFDGANLANDGEYRIVPKGHFTFRHMSDDGTFKFNVNKILDEIAVSKEYPVFEAVGMSADFLLYILNNSADFTRFALMQKKGGTRTRLYLSALRTWKPFLPSIDEQQKIADCLSSVDALIDAEKEKLKALKDRKKALMRKLFPAAGEANPRLRFPEFEDAGDWIIQPLESLCSVLNNRRKPIASNLRVSGPYPYYGASGIVDHVNEYAFDEPLILVGEDGAKWGAFERTAFIAEGRYWVNNHAHVLRPECAIGTFLMNYLVMLDFQPFVTGKAPPKLTLGKLKAIPIPTPPTIAEQSKIGSALSSMDAVIAAQTGRIEALTKHRAGLMQQLFPVTEEVIA